MGERTYTIRATAKALGVTSRWLSYHTDMSHFGDIKRIQIGEREVKRYTTADINRIRDFIANGSEAHTANREFIDRVPLDQRPFFSDQSNLEEFNRSLDQAINRVEDRLGIPERDRNDDAFEWLYLKADRESTIAMTVEMYGRLW